MTLRSARILKASAFTSGAAESPVSSVQASVQAPIPPIVLPLASTTSFTTHAHSSRIVPRHEQDAIRRANTRLAAAHREADEVLTRARNEANALVDAARAEGRSAGASELAAAWIRLREAQDALDRTHEDHALIIARVLAERLLERELTLAPTTILDLSREVLRTLSRARSLKLYAHPDDVPALEVHRAQIPVATLSLEIVADPQRTRGSLRAESDLGTLDADLSPRLDLLVAALRAR